MNLKPIKCGKRVRLKLTSFGIRFCYNWRTTAARDIWPKKSQNLNNALEQINKHVSNAQEEENSSLTHPFSRKKPKSHALKAFVFMSVIIRLKIIAPKIRAKTCSIYLHQCHKLKVNFLCLSYLCDKYQSSKKRLKVVENKKNFVRQ